MTGYRSSHFRHDCRTRGCYVQQLPSWDDLIPCFPRGIRPTDVDGMVEMNGHFLFMEEKSAGKSVDHGQHLALKRLAARSNVTVAFFRPGKTCDLQVLILGDGEPRGWEPFTRDEFRTWLRQWAVRAELPDTA